MPKRLRINDSVRDAWRQSWANRREIAGVSWLALALSFGLLALAVVFPALKKVDHIAEEFLFSIIAVGLLRKYLLGEKPDIKKAGKIPYYLKFGRREGLYGLWMIFMLLLAFLFDQAAAVAEVVPFAGPFFAEWVWPLLRDLLLSMLILIGPCIAVAEKPAVGQFIPLIEAVIGNIASVMVAVFFIFAPYYLMTLLSYAGAWFAGSLTAWHYAQYLVFCFCRIVDIRFAATVYKALAPHPSSPR